MMIQNEFGLLITVCYKCVHQNIAFLTKNFFKFQTEKAALPATMTICNMLSQKKFEESLDWFASYISSYSRS